MNLDFGTLLKQSKSRYDGLQPKQRRNIWLIGGFFSLTVIVLALVFSNPNYEQVFSNLDSKSAGQITQKLDQLKIPYELQGNTILIPAQEADKARVEMALQGLPASGNVDYSQILQQGNVFGLSDQELNLEELSVLQQRIGQSIETINGIVTAEVTIVPAQQQTFLADTSTASQAKASVVLSVNPGNSLTAQQVFGIQQLVAHAVQGLSAGNVTVVDQYGNDLSTAGASDPTTAGSGTISQELAIQQQLQQTLSSQLRDSLVSMVGYGNVQVIVHADVTFNQETQQKHVVTAGPPLSSQSSSQSNTGGSGSATGGIAGQATQNPNITTYGSTGSGGGSSSNRSQTTNYDNNYTNTTTSFDPIQINGYTVSVLINANAIKLTGALKSAIQSYVVNAVGQRGATARAPAVTVLAAPFSVTAVANPATGSSLLSGPIGFGGAAALLLIAGSVVAFLVMRSRNRKRLTTDALGSLTAAALESPPAEPEEASVTRQLQEMAIRRPESFAAIVKTWVSED